MNYPKETVDLFMDTLAKGLRFKATIYLINEKGEISIIQQGVHNVYDLELFFAKAKILHINPVFVCVKDKTDADLGNFNCQLCKKNLTGPLRKRHNCQVKPSTISDIKPFLTSTNNSI